MPIKDLNCIIIGVRNDFKFVVILKIFGRAIFEVVEVNGG